MPLVSVAAGQPIRSTHVTQFTRWVTAATKDQSATFTTTHATEYTVTITNEETSAGNALKVVSGTSTIALFNKTGVTLGVPVVATGLSLFTATGQTLYGAGGTASALLNIGSTFQSMIVSSSGVPSWSASLQSLLASAGSLVGASAANTPAHIPKGTAFQEFVMNAGATGQTWASGVLAAAVTAGYTFFATGANSVTGLAPGTARFVLGMNAGATAPTWLASPQSLLSATGGVITATAANTPIAVFPTTSGQYFRSNATGAGFESVGASNSLDKLGEVVGTGSSAVLALSGISGAYRSLYLELDGGRSTDTSAGVGTRLTFETSPTVGAYDYQRVYGSATVPTADESIGAVDYIALGSMPAATSTTNLIGSFSIHLPGYAGTSAWKNVIAMCDGSFNLASGSIQALMTVGVWESTAAITLVRVTLSAGFWTTTSRLTVWGLPA
ncbi:MAG TPA: hypothetical protein VMT30_09525 [Candidatus Saccharimonadia bacterium]|nr:hypothetical protein [Candidatus Saccharimonadia bacterium]